MILTSLKFTSTNYLVAFRKFSKAKHWSVNLTELTVLCDCSSKELQIACRDFKALAVGEPVAAKKPEKTWWQPTFLFKSFLPGRRFPLKERSI